MISEEAQKSIKRYSSLGSLIKALYFNPSKESKVRLLFQRLNYNFALKFNPKVKDGQYEEIYLGNIRSLKITTPKSDPNKIDSIVQKTYNHVMNNFNRELIIDKYRNIINE